VKKGPEVKPRIEKTCVRDLKKVIF